jgi:flagellar biosynthesis/type III secretory pathway chaperone
MSRTARPEQPNPSALGLLARERDQLRELLTLLDEEERHLVACDPQALDQCATRKRGVVSELQTLAQTRTAYAPNAANTPASASELTEHASSHTLWREIVDLARRAKLGNERNGRLIAQQSHHFHARFATILHGSSTQPAASYGVDGQRRAPGSRTLGVA